jgi:hypothetical protein
MDFIAGLPKEDNKSVIMVVVDCISKSSHLFSLTHPFTPSLVAQAFMDQIFKLHYMPTSIVSDQDSTFTDKFWQELFKLEGTQMNISTTYHTQTDGQTEVVYKCLETYLRCFYSEKSHQWSQWLPLVLCTLKINKMIFLVVVESCFLGHNVLIPSCSGTNCVDLEFSPFLFLILSVDKQHCVA